VNGKARMSGRPDPRLAKGSRASIHRRQRSVDPKIREARFALDNYECQLGKLFGIPELTGEPCSDELEFHHITYARLGHERIEDGPSLRCSRTGPVGLPRWTS